MIRKPWPFVFSSILLACSANSNGGDNGFTDGEDSSVADTGGGNGDDSSIPGDESGFNVDGSIETSATDGSGGDACIGVSSDAKLLPLDIYVMYDQSGSMSEKTGGTGSPSKWDAVKTALSSFLGDPASAGLGVGIQFFPYQPPGIPTTCTADTDCKDYGPCATNKACDKESAAAKMVIPCQTAADCKSGGNCIDVGTCNSDPTAGCFTKANCVIGTCNIPKYCQTRECKVTDYAKPEVEIAALPGVKTAIESALAAHMPVSDTPTGPALAGAISHAQAWAAAHPTHAVIVLLVTDGTPTACSPIAIPDIAKLASDAKAGSPVIRTFVIGVLGTTDTAAKTNLDTISNAGNGKPAIIVNSSSDVTKTFQDALNAIRGTALACDYELPVGAGADYFKVNIKVTTASGTSTLPYVGSAAKCDASGGWYYDVDPSMGTPKKIIMCPSTCTTFKSTTGGKIDIEVGCKTVSVVK